MTGAVVALVLAAAGGSAYALSGSASARYRIAVAAIGDVTQTVLASGTVEPAEQADLAFPVAGTVATVSVHAGEAVRAGATLAALDPALFEDAVAADEASLAAAQDRLAAAEAAASATASATPTGGVAADQQAVAAAEQALAGAEEALVTAEVRLDLADGASAPATGVHAATATGSAGTAERATTPPAAGSLEASVASAETALDAAENRLASAEVALADAEARASAQGSGPATAVGASAQAAVASDQPAVVDARAELAQAQADLAGATLTAPFTGTVESVTLSPGETVAAGGSSVAGAATATPVSTAAAVPAGSTKRTAVSGLANGGSSGAEIVLAGGGGDVVDASVPAQSISEVKVGDEVEIQAESATATAYGTVSALSTVATVNAGLATFPVVVSVTGNPPGLYPGVSANLEIVVLDERGVLTVPTAAVHTRGSRSFVYELVAGREVAHAVAVEAIGSALTQIASGLSPGDEVVLARLTGAASAAPTATGASRRALLGGGAGGGRRRLLGRGPGGGGFGGG